MKFVKLPLRAFDGNANFPQIDVSIAIGKIVSVSPFVNTTYDMPNARQIGRADPIYTVDGTNVNCGPDHDYVIGMPVDEVIAIIDQVEAN